MIDPNRFNEQRDWMGRPFHPSLAALALAESIGKPKKKKRCKRINKNSHKKK